MYCSLFFSKVEGVKPATLFKNRLWYRCFVVNFAKFVRSLILRNTCERLILKIDELKVFKAVSKAM